MKLKKNDIMFGIDKARGHADSFSDTVIYRVAFRDHKLITTSTVNIKKSFSLLNSLIGPYTIIVIDLYAYNHVL